MKSDLRRDSERKRERGRKVQCRGSEKDWQWKLLTEFSSLGITCFMSFRCFILPSIGMKTAQRQSLRVTLIWWCSQRSGRQKMDKCKWNYEAGRRKKGRKNSGCGSRKRKREREWKLNWKKYKWLKSIDQSWDVCRKKKKGKEGRKMSRNWLRTWYKLYKRDEETEDRDWYKSWERKLSW